MFSGVEEHGGRRVGHVSGKMKGTKELCRLHDGNKRAR